MRTIVERGIRTSDGVRRARDRGLDVDCLILRLPGHGLRLMTPGVPSAPEAFGHHAPAYDALRTRLVPSYDALYGAAVGALSLSARPLERVLDVGAGTGLLSRWVAAAHPGARCTLLDASEEMLAQARASLGDGAEYVHADFSDPLPSGPWDAVVSALAIHHIDDAAKRDLFARVYGALAPGGVFVNAEHVAAPSPALEAYYAAWHERRARELGADDDEWAGAVERMGYDRLASLDDQLRWLRDAGFAEVDCPFKEMRFAVLVGRRRDQA